MPIDKQSDLVGLWQSVCAYVQVLAISGLAGSIFRTMLPLKGKLKDELSKVLVAPLAAIFFGSALARFINVVTDTGIYAYVASGFIVGTGGEVAVKAARGKLHGNADKS